jgi:quercetin dioxygenase-like cupin family protein
VGAERRPEWSGAGQIDSEENVMTNSNEWRPTKDGTGVSVKLLRGDRETGAVTVLLRFDPGARFPAHRHPAGEEVFVVEGTVRIGKDLLNRGDYLYTEPGGVHAVSSEGGGTLLVVLPKPVEILEKATGHAAVRLE